MEEVRIKYSKTGDLKYISHLDIMRCFERALARAEVPLCFTHGYNPHPHIIFSSPLPLGIESECEFANIKLSDEISFNDMIKKLNNTMPNEIRIKNIYSDFMSLKDLLYTRYIFYVHTNDLERDFQMLSQILSSKEIIGEKINKKNPNNVKNINVSEQIKQFDLNIENDMIVIAAVLDSNNNSNLNPIFFFNTIIEKGNINIASKRIIKTDVFNSTMDEFY